MWSAEQVLATSAGASEVWARYSDPATWPLWDLPGSAVSFPGEFVVGGRGTLTPAGGRASGFTLVAVEPFVGFTERSRLGLTRVEIARSMTPAAAGVVLAHRVTLSGPFSRLLGSFVGPRILRQQAAALRRLVALVEAA